MAAMEYCANNVFNDLLSNIFMVSKNNPGYWSDLAGLLVNQDHL